MMTCMERVANTPIPRSYSIHLKQCVTLYLFSLPFTLVKDLGWGMIPESQMPVGVLENTHPELMTIPDLGDMDVELHWQRWNSGPDSLDRLTEAVIAAAQDMR